MQHAPTTGNTRVSGRRYLAHWLDSTIFIVLFLILIVLLGSLPDSDAADGNVPTTGALVRRTIPLLIEYFYVIAWIGMMTSRFRQRLGDRWADTYVIGDS